MNSPSGRKKPMTSIPRRSARLSAKKDGRTGDKKEGELLEGAKKKLQATFDDEIDSSNRKRDVSDNGQREGLDDEAGASESEEFSAESGSCPYDSPLICVKENLASGVNDTNQVLKRLSDFNKSYKVFCDEQNTIFEQIMLELRACCETINSAEERRAQEKRKQDEVICNMKKCEAEKLQLEKDNQILEGEVLRLNLLTSKFGKERDDFSERLSKAEDKIDKYKRNEAQLQSSMEKLSKERISTGELNSKWMAKLNQSAKEKGDLELHLRNLNNQHNETLADLYREKDEIFSLLDEMYQRCRHFELERDELEQENMRLRTLIM